MHTLGVALFVAADLRPVCAAGTGVRRYSSLCKSILQRAKDIITAVVSTAVVVHVAS